MKIKHVRVQNFKSLISVELLDLPDLVVFIGKNSSGKSNLIDALDLLFTEFGSGVDRRLGSQDDYQHLFPNHDTQVSQPPEIAAIVTLTCEEWARLLSIDLDAARSLERSEFRVSKRIVNTDGELRWKTHEVGAQTFEIVVDGEILSRDVSDIPGPIGQGTEEILSQLNELMRSSFQVIHATESPRSWPDRFAERPTIISDEHVTDLWQLSQSIGSQRQPWTRMIQRYRGVAPNRQAPVGVSSSIQVEEGNLTVPVGMTGEGSQAMLRLIDQLERGSPIIAIEEPETHLHPALVKRIGHLLAETSKDKQLFVCTHSPFLVEQSLLDSFFVVKKERDRSQVSPMRDTEGLRNLLLDIGMRPSDILFSDAILLVEGLSDEMFFDHLSNKIDVPLAGRHVKVVRANGSSRGRRKVEFWAEVGRDSGLPLYLILDKNARDEAESAISKGQIPSEHCLILEKGNLEDYYPWRVLQEVLSTQFDVAVEEAIPVGKRVERIRSLLSRKVKSRNAWKPMMAEGVANIMTHDEVESETEEIVAFLRKIYHEVGVE